MEAADEFPKWEDLSRKEQAAQYYSDVYKEKYGIRPMLDFFENLTDDEAEEALEKLYGEKGTAEYYPDEFAGDDEYEEQVPMPPWPEPPVVNAPHHQDLDGTVNPDEDVFSGEELPSRLGMGRDIPTGREKRNGGFAGDTGRKMMKLYKGR